MVIALSYAAPSSEGRPPPGLDGGVPGGAGRGVRAPVQVLEGRVVRGDEAGAGAAFDAHVADGHPLFHRQAADGRAGVLEDVAGPAADADPADERQDDVLGADARGERAVDADLVGLRVALEEGLGREDHLDLARPDPERERPERAVRARVRVAADDRHAGLGQAELRADDVDDALARRADAVERDAELGAVRLELRDLGGGLQVQHRQVARRRRDRVVRGRHRLARSADADAARAKAGEGLRAGHLVHEMEVDGEDGGGAGVLADHVVRPDLVDDGARGAHAPERTRGSAEGPGPPTRRPAADGLTGAPTHPLVLVVSSTTVPVRAASGPV